jgi:hypothetical protein
MKYSTHRITQTGHIELREVMEGGTFHRSVIAPNQPLEKYNEIIEADENWKYRTPENAEAYEASLVADQPTEEEKLDQWRSTFKTDLYKLKIVLDNMGDLEDVESIISQQPKGVQLAWENANSIRRNSPTVAGLAQVMGYSDETLDTIFKQADEVKL